MLRVAVTQRLGGDIFEHSADERHPHVNSQIDNATDARGSTQSLSAHLALTRRAVGFSTGWWQQLESIHAIAQLTFLVDPEDVLLKRAIEKRRPERFLRALDRILQLDVCHALSRLPRS